MRKTKNHEEVRIAVKSVWGGGRYLWRAGFKKKKLWDWHERM